MHTDVYLDIQVTKLLHRLGAPTHYKGYALLRTAVVFVYKSPMAVRSVCNDVYPVVAEIHGTTPSRVERNIRSLMESILWEGDAELVRTMFPRQNRTNSYFLTRLADELRLEMAALETAATMETGG